MKTQSHRWISWSFAIANLLILSGCGPEIRDFRMGSSSRGDTPVIQADQLGERGENKPIPMTNVYTIDNRQLTVPDDIIFLVDTSASMAEEKAALEQSFANFLKQLTDLGLNGYNVYMVGQGFNFSADVTTHPNFIPVDQRVFSTDALEVFLDIVDGKIPLTVPLQSDSRREIVVITDDDSNLDAATFKQELDNRGETLISVNGIIGQKQGRNTPTCNIRSIGTAYQTLAADPATLGVTQDLCSPDWSILLDNLATSFIENMTEPAFPLSHELAPDTFVTVKVNGVDLSNEGFVVDPIRNEVVFQSGYEPVKGDRVEIIFYTINME